MILDIISKCVCVTLAADIVGYSVMAPRRPDPSGIWIPPNYYILLHGLLHKSAQDNNLKTEALGKQKNIILLIWIVDLFE